MSLNEALRAAQLQARKEKRAADAAALSTLIGEADMIGKNDGNRPTTDAETAGLIQKFVKNIDDTSKHVADPAKKDALAREKALLLSFLPQRMEQARLEQILREIVAESGLSGPKAMGPAMKTLKERHGGQYDPQLASALAKAILG